MSGRRRLRQSRSAPPSCAMSPKCQTPVHFRSSSTRPVRRWGSGNQRPSDCGMAGHSVTVAAANDSRLNAYLAVPDAGSGPGLVLFPETSGADRDARDVADLYAAEGYVLLCPDGEFVAADVADITAAVAALRG